MSVYFLKYRASLRYLRSYSKICQLDLTTEVDRVDFFFRRHHEFESIFNIFPFLWLEYFFVTITGDITLVTDMTSIIVHSMTYLLDTLFVMAVIFALDVMMRKEKKTAIIACDEIMSNETVPFEQRILITMEIKDKMCTQTLTGSGLFFIDRSLILTFLGSTVSFSVLFTQISWSDKK
jgi:hypothetical protein